MKKTGVYSTVGAHSVRQRVRSTQSHASAGDLTQNARLSASLPAVETAGSGRTVCAPTA